MSIRSFQAESFALLFQVFAAATNTQIDFTQQGRESAAQALQSGAQALNALNAALDSLKGEAERLQLGSSS
jgi:hypothetical protein